jgi:peptidoglycan/LPS O-acetylase OafA/YrhL
VVKNQAAFSAMNSDSQRPGLDVSSLPSDRLQNLDIFRAVAALAVCFFHFQRESLTGGTLYEKIFQYGHYGVDIFFVISGYVIPLALLKKRFRLRDTGIFLQARFFRLYPAYILAAFLTMGLWYASVWVPGFRGDAPPPLTWPQVLANLTLSCDFFHQDWFGVVFWTLAIEAQYYVVVALSLGFLFHGKAAWRYMALAPWIFLPLIFKGGATVFGWSTLFAMGILLVLRQTGLISKWAFIVGLLAAVWVQTEIRSPVSGMLGSGTALGILFLPNLGWKPLIWIGGISYSLYLLHVPIGGRVMNFLERYSEWPWAGILCVPLALAASLVAAWVFFLLVEKPSHESARRISRTGKL